MVKMFLNTPKVKYKTIIPLKFAKKEEAILQWHFFNISKLLINGVGTLMLR